MLRIMVINGPNLNLLGRREPEIYGRASYADLVKLIYKHCEEMQVQCKIMQSNHEGALVDAIQQAADFCDGIVINPAAYTHTSVAILDAVKAVALPTVEVHISKMEEREDFRQHSYVRAACVKTITGQGFAGYRQAAEFLVGYLQEK